LAPGTCNHAEAALLGDAEVRNVPLARSVPRGFSLRAAVAESAPADASTLRVQSDIPAEAIAAH
jgi:hypothetical protein